MFDRFFEFAQENWLPIVFISLPLCWLIPIPFVAALAGYLFFMMIIVVTATCVMGVLCGDIGAGLTLIAGILFTIAGAVTALVTGAWTP